MISLVVMITCYIFTDVLAQGGDVNLSKKEPREVETGCVGAGINATSALKDIIFAKPKFPYPDRVGLNCEDIIVTPLAPYSAISIVSVINPSFCKNEYCLTYVYDHRTRSIIFLTEARKHFKIIVAGMSPDRILSKFFSHKFSGRYNVLRLHTSGGELDLTFGFDEIPIVEIN